MPAANSTRIPTRSRAACMASACRWSMPCRRTLEAAHLAQRQGTLHELHQWRSRCAAARSSAMPTASKGTEVTFLPSPHTFTKTEFDYRHPRASPARAGLPQFRRAHHAHRPARRRAQGVETMHYEGGIEAFVRYLDRTKKRLICRADHHPRRARRHHRSNAPCGGTTAITRTCCASPTTSRSATAAPISPASAPR